MKKEDLKIYGRYNWVNQPERLIYVGTQRYNGDPRTWYQFELVCKPGKIWCEVLESDLESIEETQPENDPEKQNEDLWRLGRTVGK